MGQEHIKGVYPRVCGGTLRRALIPAAVAGLSPRVRGNLQGVLPAGAADGSIPACAGEPQVWSGWVRLTAVYPRVCGGTRPANDCAVRKAGLSPRVRGNLTVTDENGKSVGSIPACAGEPACPRS